jgi:hypothetical protein
MRAVVISILTVITMLWAVQEYTHTGTDAVNFYTTVDPDDAVYMEEFAWQIISCEPVYDLHDASEPIVSHNIKVSFVTEDNPAFGTYELDADENEKVLVSGQWVRFDEYERSLTPDTCTTP